MGQRSLDELHTTAKIVLGNCRYREKFFGHELPSLSVCCGPVVRILCDEGVGRY